MCNGHVPRAFYRTVGKKKSEKAELNLTADRIKLQSFFTWQENLVLFFVNIYFKNTCVVLIRTKKTNIYKIQNNNNNSNKNSLRSGVENVANIAFLSVSFSDRF